jgi:hypothetical protein
MSNADEINSEPRRHSAAQSFTAQKLAAVDRLLVDERATDLDFRVFWYLVSASDRETGIARRKQQTIADAVGRTRRGVQLSLDRLEAFSFIIIEKKEGGSYANGYRIVLEKASVNSFSVSTNANLDSPFVSKKANASSPLVGKRRTGDTKKANAAAEKGEPSFAPILPLNHLDIPYRGRTRRPNGLGPAGAALRQDIGNDVFRAWFSKVTVESETEEKLVLRAPSKFFASHLRIHYESAILRAWHRTTLPRLQCIDILFS